MGSAGPARPAGPRGFVYLPAVPVPLLSELFNQPDASQFLRRVAASRRFGNAYLFHGPAGVGKGTAALAFARAMLCDRGAVPPVRALAGEPSLFGPPEPPKPPDPTVFDALDDACGRCSQCRRAETLQHPDLKFLFPVWGEEKIQSEQIAETLQSMRDDPFHVFQYEKAATIRIGLTRDLLRDLGYRPYEAERRVVVVRDADRMREDQYSAMLKAIEEPGATVWILTTSRPSRLPATIRSRTQKVRFAAIPEPEIQRFLIERAGTPEREAVLVAALASGSLGRALTLRDQAPLAQRNTALGLLDPALRKDAPGLWIAAQKFMSFGRTGRETLRLMVEFHQLWLRDLLRARYGAPAELLVNRDRDAEIRKAAEKVDATEVRRRLMVLEEMLRSIDGNVSPDVALFSGLARVAGSRMGENQWPQHPIDRWSY